MSEKKYAIIGLPGTGKTSFLAAFWNLISSSEPSLSMKLHRHVGNSAYLNEIVRRWLTFQKQDRTSSDKEQEVDLHLEVVDTKEVVQITFPDLAGESFDFQVGQRKCKDSYLSFANEAGGFMLFVTADKGIDGLEITDMPSDDESEDEPDLLASQTADPAAEESGGISESDTHGGVKEHVEWQPKFIPQQVANVELLQFLARPPFSTKFRRIAVVVSAWDVIEQKITPAEWVAKEMPLLNQYLMNNFNPAQLKYFGVSAIGGSLAQKTALAKVRSHQRVYCLDESEKTLDLTKPLAWLTSALE